MQVKRLQLCTDRLPELRTFYTHLLGFELLETSENHFVVACGSSQLAFVQGKSAYYHFAFNIVPDQITAAAAWIQARGLALLPLDGESIVPFPNWEASSIYFHDPAGNIVEFIARRRLPQRAEGPFSSKDVLCISEIGIGTFDFEGLMMTLNTEMQVPIFGKPSPIFCALGDDHGLFILVDAHQKKWIPHMEPALPFPFQAELVQDGVVWDLRMDDQWIVSTAVIAGA